MDNCVIGVDIGGTNIRVGLIDENLSLVRKETALTGSFKDADEMITQIKKMIGLVDPEKKANLIGIAIPVPWKNDNERILDCTNIPCLETVEIKQITSIFSGYEVYFENDVNVISLLESEHGASKEYRHSIYITVSTGIGGGIIINNEILHGAHGYAGEIGSMIVSDSKKNHSTLYDGTLESLCSGKALEYESRALYGIGATTELLFEKYLKGDQKAQEAIDLWVHYFSNGIASLMQTFDPDVFVLGGSVILHNPWLIEKLLACVRQKVFKNLIDKVKIVLSQFGPDAGIIGAGYMSIKHAKGAGCR